jgi:hypothetical protein
MENLSMKSSFLRMKQNKTALDDDRQLGMGGRERERERKREREREASQLLC